MIPSSANAVRGWVFGLLWTVVVTGGCHSLRERTDALKNSTRDLLSAHKKADKRPGERPERMVAVWSESSIFGPNQTPTRGIGGRIFLYNARHQAVEAEGELVVYAYNDTPGQDDQVEPDRKYVIPAEDFAKHYSPSDLGPSYSVWIPWDAVGNETASVSLVPILRPTEGQAVVGDHSRTLLPGKPKPTDALARRARVANDPAGVQPASFHEQQATTQEAPAVGHVTTRVKTSTIQVPPSMRQRLLQEVSEEDRARLESTWENERRQPSSAANSASPPHESMGSGDLTETLVRPSVSRLSVRREPFQPRAPAWRAGLQGRDLPESPPGPSAWPYAPPAIPEDSQLGKFVPNSPRVPSSTLPSSPPVANSGIRPATASSR